MRAPHTLLLTGLFLLTGLAGISANAATFTSDHCDPLCGPQPTGFATIDLSNLSASDGFIIQGDIADDRAGQSVSAAGDVNVVAMALGSCTPNEFTCRNV